VRVWDVETGTELHRLSVGDIPRGVAIASDGKHVAASEHSGLVRLWNLGGPRPIALSLPQLHSYGPNSVAFSPDGAPRLSAPAVKAASSSGMLGSARSCAPGSSPAALAPSPSPRTAAMCLRATATARSTCCAGRNHHPDDFTFPAVNDGRGPPWFCRAGSGFCWVSNWQSVRRPRVCRPRLEALEDRITPAHNIIIATGGSATIPAGASTFSDTGDYTIAPTALNAVASGTISLKANTDITVNNNVLMANGVSLTALAGRNLTLTSTTMQPAPSFPQWQPGTDCQRPNRPGREPGQPRCRQRPLVPELRRPRWQQHRLHDPHRRQRRPGPGPTRIPQPLSTYMA